MDQTIARGEVDGLSIDMSPLAWVLEDLKKSLKSASATIRRFAWEVKIAPGEYPIGIDTGPLSDAQRQFQQGAIALDMVGQQVTALMLRAVDSLSRQFIHAPRSCNDDAAQCVDRACLAVIDYLGGLLKGRKLSPVALFPQHRAILVRIGAQRIHPADLWTLLWRWRDIDLPRGQRSEPYGSEMRTRMDHSLLKILRSGDRDAAREMAEHCAALAAGQVSRDPATLWALAAAFFEAIALDLLPKDIYVKRAASNVLQQYGALYQGTGQPSARFAQDLAFFCAMAHPSVQQSAPYLEAVRQAYALDEAPVQDYEIEKLGRIDAVQLDLVRRKIASASESWSGFVNGEFNHAGALADLFSELGDAVLKVHPEHAAFVSALRDGIELAIRVVGPPRAALAMEVATSILYLEATYTDLDTDSSMVQRSAHLAARLHHVCSGNDSYPIEDWMEQLYRRISDQQSMGSVTRELRISLIEVERALDQFFRNGRVNAALHAAPGHLAQMRGVFLVLGLEQAAIATMRMRATIEQYVLDGAGTSHQYSVLFDTLGSSLGAMGFLVDMLGYQLALARRMFVYDEECGEFRSIIDRDRSPRPQPHTSDAVSVDPDPSSIQQETLNSFTPIFQNIEGVWPAQIGTTPDPGAGGLGAERIGYVALDQEIREIFLEEGKEVIHAASSAIQELTLQAASHGAQVRLRRAFHTLKGSARMVDLNVLGEAAWAFEQLLNDWLADQAPFTGALLGLTSSAVRAFGMWVEDISRGRDAPWSSDCFRESADAFRISGEYKSLRLPDHVPQGSGEDRPDMAPVMQTMELRDQSASESYFDLFHGLPLASAQEMQGLFVQPVSSENRLPDSHASVGDDPSLIAVGHLRLRPAFFDVYIAEASEWSVNLLADIEQWMHDPASASTDRAMALAHSLHGASAAVGFDALVDTARVLEQALERAGAHPMGAAKWGQPLLACARHIGDLLAQFAGRSLPKSEESIAAEMHGIITADESAPDAMPMNDLTDAISVRPVDELEVSADAVARDCTAQTQNSNPVAAGNGKHGELTLPGVVPPVAANSYVPPQDASALARIVHPDPSQDEELESEDAIDAELLPIFREEGNELFLALGSSLRVWASRPEELRARSQSLRLLHTIKGSARLAGALRLGELAHRLESRMTHIRADIATASEVDASIQLFDQLRSIFDGLGPAPVAPTQQKAPANSPVFQPIQPAVLPGAQRGQVGDGSSRWLIGQSIRVRSKVLDRLLDQTGEVMIGRSRMDANVSQMGNGLADLGNTLKRMRNQLRELELQADLQMQTRQTPTQGAAQLFDPLEFDRFTRVQELGRLLAESVEDVATVQRNLQICVQGAQDDVSVQGRRAKELQHDLLRMRLVEFESIADRLYAVVRQAAKATGKQVRLDISAGTIELDRGVLDRITPALEHILRNAVGHGIEPLEVRLAGGKSAIGSITIAVAQDGGDVSVTIGDDGRGLDIDSIRKHALAKKLWDGDADFGLQDAVRMLFLPGFTTAQHVTEMEGRGIGMDVVRSEVDALGGRIDTKSVLGVGTSFELVLPLTTAVTQVVLLRMGGFTMGVPSNLMETVLRVPSDTLDRAYQDGSMVHQGNRLPFYWGGNLLQVSGNSLERSIKQNPVAVFRSAGRRVALHIDEVFGNREVIVKNLGPQLSRLPGMAGMTVMATGSVVFIYNPIALATVYAEPARRRRVPPQPNALDVAAGGDRSRSVLLDSTRGHLAGADERDRQLPLVLVVDDSITVRRVAQRLLRREGFRVVMANDGLHALEQLQFERPKVVLTDIEMPRMDGFELTRSIRADASLADLPIIMITSRIAQKHRDHAASLGVNHYMGKPYSELDLMAVVRRYCAETVLG
ncbi:MAG: Hpt domain-containing protein [Betaproteobacteria bacterium]